MNPRLQAFLKKTGEYSDDDLAQMRIAIAESNFKTNIPLEPQELLSIRASIEILQSIRVFDRASARLVETTNKLTRLGVALAAVGAVLGVAALWISCLGYRLALSQVGK